jgi:hypothetical protein
MPVDPKKSVVNAPEGVSAQGIVEDVAQAYMEAMISLPEILTRISEDLSVIALYFERKGKEEMLFTDEDLSEAGEEQGS